MSRIELCKRPLTRHLVAMPDIEYSTFQFNWLDYPAERKDEVSPWLEAFVNAKNWIDKKNKI
jgi:phosphoribosylformylglycinamidine synthase